MLDLPPRLRKKEGGLFLYGAATPVFQEGKFAGRHIFLGITRIGSSAGGLSPLRALERYRGWCCVIA